VYGAAPNTDQVICLPSARADPASASARNRPERTVGAGSASRSDIMILQRLAMRDRLALTAITHHARLVLLGRPGLDDLAVVRTRPRGLQHGVDAPHQMCPATPWGREVVGRIDAVLETARPRPDYREIVEAT
jgi:hypothetical protein